MSTGWTVVIVASIVIYAFKAAAPVILGDRALPRWLTGISAIMPAALLAALVVVSTFDAGRRLQLDARAVGLTAAAIALWRKQNFVVVVAVAALATAAARALT